MVGLPCPETFTSDLDGNLTSGGWWLYIRDAENRPVSRQTHLLFAPGIIPGAHGRGEGTEEYLLRLDHEQANESADPAHSDSPSAAPR